MFFTHCEWIVWSCRQHCPVYSNVLIEYSNPRWIEIVLPLKQVSNLWRRSISLGTPIYYVWNRMNRKTWNLHSVLTHSAIVVPACLTQKTLPASLSVRSHGRPMTPVDIIKLRQICFHSFYPSVHGEQGAGWKLKIAQNVMLIPKTVLIFLHYYCLPGGGGGGGGEI